MICEACEMFIVQATLKLEGDDENEKEYRLCMNCLSRLVRHSLSKKEFRSLIRNGHSVREHLLHGDFYDPKTAEAMQPS